MRRLSKAAFFVIIFSLLLAFTSCAYDDSGRDNSDESEPQDEKIIIPDAPAGTSVLKFNDITYKRPIFENIRAKYEEAILAITDAYEFDECINRINAAESAVKNFMTMYSYATIKTHIDASDKYYCDEYALLAEWYPTLSRLEEELYSAAAASPDKNRFESEYFGEGLISKYSDGGIYTDEAVSLLEKEAALLSKYNSLSTSSVKITYETLSDTYDNVAASLRDRYGENSNEYKAAMATCYDLYNAEIKKASTDIFTELVILRANIADTLGYDSYTDYAYDVLGHDYTSEQIESFIADIAKYAVPVYQKLSVVAFKNLQPKKVNTASVVNTLSATLKSIDKELYDVYSYMLYSGLFDIEKANKNRFDGSFTTYLGDYSSPYLFVTAAGNMSDYMTVSHEFGHFYDYFVNGGDETSLDLVEISSQALEMLALCELKGELSSKDYSRLFRFQMKSVLQTLIYQAFYAKFEHIVYAIPTEELTRERIDEAVVEAADALAMNTAYYNSLSDIMITHLFNSPLYVQSYATSLLSSLEIFFAEADVCGEGVRIYRELVKREEGLDYLEHLGSVGLSSPFDENLVKNLADKIHFTLIGSHFFDEYKNPGFVMESQHSYAA